MGIAKDTNKAVVDGHEYSEGEDIEDEAYEKESDYLCPLSPGQ